MTKGKIQALLILKYTAYMYKNMYFAAFEWNAL